MEGRRKNNPSRCRLQFNYSFKDWLSLFDNAKPKLYSGPYWTINGINYRYRGRHDDEEEEAGYKSPRDLFVVLDRRGWGGLSKRGRT